MTEPPRIRVLCVDDHAVIREGIAAVLQNASDMILVGEAGDGLEAVDRFKACRPDVSLVDLQMPRMNGLEVITAIRRLAPEAKIVVLTTYKGDVRAKAALKAGAAGYLLKSMLMSDLLDTIRAVYLGRKRILTEVAQELAVHAADETLSEREISVLRLVAAGNQNKQIAHQMGITEMTVKVHMRHITEKLGVKDRTHAVTVAIQRGIIDL